MNKVQDKKVWISPVMISEEVVSTEGGLNDNTIEDSVYNS